MAVLQEDGLGILSRFHGWDFIQSSSALSRLEKMRLNCSKLQQLYYQRTLHACFGAAKQLFGVAACFKAPLADMVWVAGENGRCWNGTNQSCAPPFGSVGTQLQLQEGWGYLLFP